MKTCTICGQSKDYSQYHKQAASKDGHCGMCKQCKSDRKKAEYLANPGPAKERASRYRLANPSKASECKRRCYQNKHTQYRSRMRASYEANRDSVLAAQAEYRSRNREAKAARDREYVRNRMATDPLFRMTYAVRNRIFYACRDRRITKGTKTSEIIGCDWATLKAHLEARFLAGMGWSNYGEWHVDHEVPLASAKSEAELFALCHYKNLQPLWAADNIRKGAKIMEAA